MKKERLKDSIGHDILSGKIKFNLTLTNKEKRVLESDKIRFIGIEGLDKTGKTALIDQLIKIRKTYKEHVSRGSFLHDRYKKQVYLKRFKIDLFTYSSKLSVVFIKSGVHKRIIKSIKEAMLDYADETFCELKDHPFSEAMFSFFYADYISVLKKIVRLAQHTELTTVVFDRTWISNYIYNKKELDDPSTNLQELLQDDIYKIKLGVLFVLDKHRLIANYPKIDYSLDDFYERRLNDGWVFQVEKRLKRLLKEYLLEVQKPIIFYFGYKIGNLDKHSTFARQLKITNDAIDLLLKVSKDGDDLCAAMLYSFNQGNYILRDELFLSKIIKEYENGVGPN